MKIIGGIKGIANNQWEFFLTAGNIGFFIKIEIPRIFIKMEIPRILIKIGNSQNFNRFIAWQPQHSLSVTL